MNITKVMTPKGIERLAEGRTTCYPILKKALADDDVRTWFRAPLMSIPRSEPGAARVHGDAVQGLRPSDLPRTGPA